MTGVPRAPFAPGRTAADANSALLRDLEQATPGSVRSRISDRLALAHDASHYLLTPHAVVTPSGVAEVAATLAAAHRNGMPITFRSGGTSLSGQASTDGILVDTRREFRSVTVLDSGLRVRVQPGATVRQVNIRLARYGRKLGPDPASEAACTIGGVVANNSSGMACGTEFNSYNTMESAVLILPSGTTIDTAHPEADRQLREAEPELHEGLLRLRRRIHDNPESLRAIARQYSIKNTMGYGLNAFIDHESPVDILCRLVIGSEGTLAFVAEATFRTVPLKSNAATGLLVFDSLRDATSHLPELVAAGLATIELLDATSLRVAQRDPEAQETLKSIPVRDHAALLVEYQEETPQALAERIDASGSLLRSLPLTTPARLDTAPAARAALWHIRKGLYATVAGNRPAGSTALLEDIAVPVGSLLQTCESLVELFSRHRYSDSVIFGHAKDGNIHFMLTEHFDDKRNLDRYIAFTDDMVDLVLGMSGTLKAEHGTGRIMAPFVRRQFGDELYEVMLEIKRLCDPRMVLNPGVLINEDPASHIANLKVTLPIEEEADRCVECGYCEPVCPSKDLTLTPRQRIVLRRERAAAEAAGDTALVRQLDKEYQYDGIDTCAVDGMCQTACPVLIDTGSLVQRLRAEQTSRLEQSGWRLAAKGWGAVTRAGGLALSTVQRLPAPAVTGMTRVARSILGADTVPLWQEDLPGGGSPRKPRSNQDAQAVYFSACIGTMFGPAPGSSGVGPAFLRLCERAGITVTIPEGISGLCCGTPWKSKGMTEGYAEMRERVLPILWDASRQGELPIVCDASSCTEGLEHLISTPDDRFPGLRIIDAVAFGDEQLMPRLVIDEKIASLALHPTCSSTRLGLNDALSRIASAVAEEVVIPDDWGCCGFAGDRGMLHPELTESATRAEAAALSTLELDAYASTNRTCEVGMSRATGRDYVHVLELLDQVSGGSKPDA